jgi:molecular chaperone HtpG
MAHTETGNLSIHSENILPIIKKWLYSDEDIFARELVSNGADAVTKLKKLADLGEAPAEIKNEAFAIKVQIDKENKALSFTDNGIGMTGDEIKEYINQIAFSGASEFLEKYKDKMDKDNEIIGHFGLGFYSSFMVADRVQIDSLSYKEGAEAVKWICDGGIEFEMGPSDRAERGTTVTLFVNENCEDYLQEYKLRSVLTKYCSFVPVEIYLETLKDADEVIEAEEHDHEHDHDHEHEHEHDHEHDHEHEHEDEDEPKEPEGPKPINDTHPLWLKQTNDVTDEEYKAFYHKVFTDFNEPLFWIHLNMDYPFRLKGILFFPKLKHDLEYIEGQVKLYNNQVFVADNIKEVIPEYLLLLKGVMDCPDLPLNVSRSFLQNDGYVKKMSGYISKKVADKINSLFKKDREKFNGYWEDIAPFIKYGCIKERDFYDKIKPILLFKTTAGDLATLEEFTERNKDKTDKTVFYITNEQLQAQYVKMFKEQGLEAIYLNTNLDNPFISYLETYERDIKFNRIDADLTDALKDKDADNAGEKKQYEDIEALFRKTLDNNKLKVSVETLKSESVSAVMLLSEQSRRMQEMSKMFGGMDMPGMFEEELTLVLNRSNSLVKMLMVIKDETDRAGDVDLIVRQLFDLAMLSHKPLPTEQMTQFIERSNLLLERAASAAN